MAGDRPDFYDLIARNRRRTWVLLFAFFVLLGVVGAVISLSLGGGIVGVIIGVGASFGLTFASYFQSDTIALRATRAVEADPSEYSRLHNLVAEVSLAAGVPQPRVFVVHDPSPNAFATGRKPETAAVAVTTGLMDKMNRAELEGVIAHEIAHIRNGDILVMTVAVATAGAIALIADIFWRMLYWGALTGGGASHRRRSNDGNNGPNPIIFIGMIVVAVLAPLAAALLRAAVSRSRESLADATAVEITRYPGGLRQALEKLDADITVVRRTSHATSHLWIESPDDQETGARGRKFNEMFSTHPPLSERIDILRQMEGLPPYEGPDPVVAESLRTMQDDRAVSGVPRGVSASLAGSADSALATVDLAAVFPGMGEVAEEDDDPDHAPAGWYHDPESDDGALRYWDGRRWTEHRHHIPDRNRMAPTNARRSRLPRPPRRSGRAGR
ncbi:MAG: M48 family metalloprotease [Acidimicrobiales bacterium]|nr:M48 family metalloprotease [Acidimicrobiales bacterium]